MPLFLFSLAMAFDLPPWKRKPPYLLLVWACQACFQSHGVNKTNKLAHNTKKKRGGRWTVMYTDNCFTVLSPTHLRVDLNHTNTPIFQFPS
jgi:hypothetical protein